MFTCGPALSAPSGDPYWKYVTSLLHFNGTNGSTIFTDVIPGITWTATSATISTTQSKFGGTSGFFNGSGYISSNSSANLSFGSSDFTIECWIYPTGSGDRCVFDSRGTGAGNGLYSSLASLSNKYGVSNNSAILASGTVITSSVWSHFALCKKSGILYGFSGGILGFTISDSRTLVTPMEYFVGATSVPGQNYSGYIDEFRVTNGVARYISNFTPPTTPFPNG